MCYDSFLHLLTMITSLIILSVTTEAYFIDQLYHNTLPY